MRITDVHLKNFRCFPEVTFSIKENVIILQGENGSGKTSILESLYIACYLRSFRTHVARDIIAFDAKAFFVKLNVIENEETLNNNQIILGYAKDKKVIKINQETVSSFKKLFTVYRVISITEDDLFLIQGYPQYRRNFIDHIMLLMEPEFSKEMRVFKSVLQQRNALLKTGNTTPDSYQLWTKQLIDKTKKIQTQRKAFLKILEEKTNNLLKHYFSSDVTISFIYNEAKDIKNLQAIKKDELRYRRSLFGAHLDDITITYKQKHTRSYASRGQQKLVLLLAKIAQMQIVEEKHGSMLLLLDDFLTDFDQKHIETLLSLLCSINNQLFITIPLKNLLLYKILKKNNIPYQIINL